MVEAQDEPGTEKVVRKDWKAVADRAANGRSKSRTITFVVTRLPASLHTRAAALSSANPRRPNAPVLVQEVRWWPRESMVRPQLHVC